MCMCIQSLLVSGLLSAFGFSFLLPYGTLSSPLFLEAK